MAGKVVCVDNGPFAIGTSQHFRWLKGIAKWLLVLNLLDGTLTLAWIHLGVAEEANLLLRDVANHSALAFIAVKVTLVSAGTILLWRHRCHPFAVAALLVGFLVYYVVFLHHLGGSTIFAAFGL